MYIKKKSLLDMENKILNMNLANLYIHINLNVMKYIFIHLFQR